MERAEVRQKRGVGGVGGGDNLTPATAVSTQPWYMGHMFYQVSSWAP